MKKIIILISLLLLSILLSGCDLTGTELEASATPASDQIATQIAQHVNETNTAISLLESEVPANTEDAPTVEVLPSQTPGSTQESTLTLEPSNTPEPSQTPTITPTEGPCYQAKFIQDVSIPDQTEFSPGDSFTKTWRLQNTGTCTWDTGYKIIFNYGDQMGGNPEKMLTDHDVETGHTIDISINMIAPAAPGEYQGFWKLRAPDGTEFGIDSPYDNSFWVDIIVVQLYNFSMSVYNINICGYGPGVVFAVTNTGSEFFESANWEIEDLDSVNAAIGYSDNPFGNNPNACGSGDEDMDPGATYYITAKFIGVVGGHDGKFTLELCSEDGMTGTCVTKILEFVIPEVPTP